MEKLDTVLTPHSLIGLHGYARAGKDTAAQGLVERGFARVAFADPLRRALYRINPWVGPGDLRSVVDVEGWEKAKARPEVRRLLQELGVSMREEADPDVWVNAAMREAVRRDVPVVFSDTRFPNEARAIRANGGLVIRVDRPGTEPALGHYSDNPLPTHLIDATVANTSTPSALQAEVVRIAEEGGLL